MSGASEKYMTAVCPVCHNHKFFIDGGYIVCASCMQHFKYEENTLAQDLIKLINETKSYKDGQGDLF